MFSVREDKSAPIINENILFEKVNYIDLDGNFHSDITTKSVLDRVNLDRHVLVLVSPGQRTARLFLTKDFKHHIVNSKIKQRKTKTLLKTKARNLQITWNIGDNDLKHRLNKGIAYLKKGDRLDIIVGARKTKLTRDKEQRDAMLATIRKTLEPYGYEWMKMSVGFPNVELWFQGFDPNKSKEGEEITFARGEEQKTPEDAKSNEPVVDFSGQDNKYLSEEEEEAATKKFRNRARQLKEAEKKWKALFGPKEQDDPYWKSLSDPTHNPSEPSALPPKPKKEPNKENRSPKSRDVEAVRAEFDRQLRGEKLKEQQKELEKLQTVATQFAKLGIGKKSMFGGKLAGK